MSLKSIWQNWFGGRQPGAPTIRIVKQSRESVDLEYRDANQALLLKGEFVGPKWKQLNVEVPSAKCDGQTLDNIALSLQNRGYEYMVFRFGEVQVVPESERNAALAELQSMGFQVDVSPDRRSVRQSRAPGAPLMSREEAKEKAPRIMHLVQAVRGVRRPIEVLRKSDSAVV